VTVVRQRIEAADATVYEDHEVLSRNMTIACQQFENAELQNDSQRWTVEDLAKVDFESNPYAGSDLYYRVLYPSTSGNPAELYALADGYEDGSASWNSKATVYLASLTLFAIALYLFGQALGVGGRWQTRTFLSFGIVFVFLSSGWAAITWGMRSGISGTIPEQCRDVSRQDVKEDDAFIKTAAHYYGLGEATYRIAHQSDQYEKATDLFDCAVTARPGFARAQTMRLSAFEQSSSVWRDDTYIPIPSWVKLKEAADLEESKLSALRRMGATPTGETSAFYKITLALLYGDRAPLRESIFQLQRLVDDDQIAVTTNATPGASSRTTDHPSRYFNLGLALLADGRAAEAQNIFRHAIDDLGAARDWNTVLETETDLNMFVENCAKLHSDDRCRELISSAKRIKEALAVASWARFEQASIALADVSLDVTPSAAGWTATVNPTGSSLEGHKLMVMWYLVESFPENGKRKTATLSRAIKGLSGNIDLSKLVDKNGKISWSADYLRHNVLCLPEGRYVAEFYLDGHLLPQVGYDDANPSFKTYLSRYLNMTMCMPRGWIVVLTGLWQMPIRIFYDEHNEPAAVLYMMYADRGRPAETLKVDSIAKTISFITKSKQDVGMEIARRLVTFSDCKNAYPQGSLPHKEWVTSEGFVHGLIIWSPTLAREDVCGALSSVQNYFEPETLEDAQSR
jgi:tetratricopeptide (TPR) repeat protein